MKSTGEAIGYDNSLTRALYKSLQSSGMTVANYGTIFVTIADHDKQRALPLIRRFYNLGFNIEATKGTCEFLRSHGIRTRHLRKLSEGSTEIIDSLRKGHVTYVINTIDVNQHSTRRDGYEIRRAAVENNGVGGGRGGGVEESEEGGSAADQRGVVFGLVPAPHREKKEYIKGHLKKSLETNR